MVVAASMPCVACGSEVWGPPGLHLPPGASSCCCTHSHLHVQPFSYLRGFTPGQQQQQQLAHHTKPGGTKRTRAEKSRLCPTPAGSALLPPAHSVPMRTVKPPWAVIGPSGCRSTLPCCRGIAGMKAKGGKRHMQKLQCERCAPCMLLLLLPTSGGAALDSCRDRACRGCHHFQLPVTAIRSCPPGAPPNHAVVSKADVRGVQQIL